MERAGLERPGAAALQEQSAAAASERCPYAFWRLLDAIAGSFGRLEPPWPVLHDQESREFLIGLLLLALCWRSRQQTAVGDGLWPQPRRPL